MFHWFPAPASCAPATFLAKLDFPIGEFVEKLVGRSDCNKMQYQVLFVLFASFAFYLIVRHLVRTLLSIGKNLQAFRGFRCCRSYNKNSNFFISILSLLLASSSRTLTCFSWRESNEFSAEMRHVVPIMIMPNNVASQYC